MSTASLARAVAERATACPALQRAAGAWLGTTPRQRPLGGHFRDVLVCGTLYPMGESAAVLVGGRRLELPFVSVATPRLVLVTGGSGCRGDLPHKPQPCTGDGFTKVWPFGVIAEDEKRLSADPIIHVGDYNYRNTPRDMVLASPPSCPATCTASRRSASATAVRRSSSSVRPASCCRASSRCHRRRTTSGRSWCRSSTRSTPRWWA
ncbi:MAG: hypothetical protein GEV13_21910 [Rhodospirillales bacterium]|nr:hypothetical protein [Rhodospirillales bacterium]